MAMKYAQVFVMTIVVGVGLPEYGHAQYHAVGLGSASCGAWTTLRQNRQSDGAEQWVLGFLSGVGFSISAADPLRGVDGFGVAAWIDNYCLAHPIDHIVGAAKAFYNAHPR